MKSTMVAVMLMLASGYLAAQPTFDSGSTGVDGDLVVNGGNSPYYLDTAAHPDGVFNYASISIEYGGAIRVIPGVKNTPIVILVSGDCVLNGSIYLDGAPGDGVQPGAGGAGGFRGGRGHEPPISLASPGQGPGGGKAVPPAGLEPAGGGSNQFMRASLHPLIGGSGGGGGSSAGAPNLGGGGGGGGGSLLIAVSGTLTSYGNNSIFCNGGNGGTLINVQGSGSYDGGGGGSGGSIRLISTYMVGSTGGGAAVFTAKGGAGGSGSPTGRPGNNGDDGVIRLETFRFDVSGHLYNGTYYRSLPGLVNEAEGLPQLRISKIAGVAIPADAGANDTTPEIVIPPGTGNPVPFEVTATNIKPGVPVTLRVVTGDAGGTVRDAQTGALAGTIDVSTATATVDLSAGVGTVAAILETAPDFSGAGIAVSSAKPAPEGSEQSGVEKALAGMSLKLDGERVTRVERVAQVGGKANEVVYKTGSGKEYRVADSGK